MKKPILITTLGYPGSGKSYFSERLAKAKNFVHINADRTRHSFLENPTFSSEETQGLLRVMDMIADELLDRGISVIYDANMSYRAYRKRTATLAKKHGARYAVVWIQTDVPVAEKRLIERSKRKKKDLLYPPLDVSILHKIKDRTEPPTKTEPVIIIDGHAPFAKQLKQLQKQIRL